MQSQHGYLYCIGEWEAKQGETRQACSKRDKATYLFIVLDKAGYSLQQHIAEWNGSVCKAYAKQSYARRVWGVLCETRQTEA